MDDPVDVIVSPEVLVAALSGVSAAAVQFPTMPPKTLNAEVDTIGAFVLGADDFALILSETIVEAVVSVLTDPRGLDWSFRQADTAVDVMCQIALGGRGGFVTPNMMATLPTGVGLSDEIALRTAASTDLGSTRAVVTNTRRLYQHISSWSQGPTVEQHVALLSPERFRDLVHRVRWTTRPQT